MQVSAGVMILISMKSQYLFVSIFCESRLQICKINLVLLRLQTCDYYAYTLHNNNYYAIIVIMPIPAQLLHVIEEGQDTAIGPCNLSRWRKEKYRVGRGNVAWEGITAPHSNLQSVMFASNSPSLKHSFCVYIISMHLM